MVTTLPARAGLRVVPPGALTAAIAQEDKQKAENAALAVSAQAEVSLAGMVRTKFDTFKRHRDNVQAGWTERLLSAMRVYNGQYDAAKLAEIQKFGGSTVYARLVAMKCRSASSLLRDVYLGAERPYTLQPPQDPEIPPEVFQSIQDLVRAEIGAMQEMGGQPPDAAAIRDRVVNLMDAARTAARKKAKKQTDVAEDKIEEILVEGGFYKALADFLTDLPLFPFAVIKGPTVRIVPVVKWSGGMAATVQVPKLFWQRVSPFDVWWTPGVSDIEDAEVIERTRITRADLNDLLDLPGYNHDAIRSVLDDYGRGGLNENWDQSDAERANLESRENPHWNQSGLINCLEFHGNVQGRQLLEAGMKKSQVPDELRDYFVTVWVIGRHVIKAQISPSPRKRHPYFVTSFEKVPGSVVGNGLPDILGDIQDVANATLRSLVNNMSISSGPQVVVNTERVAPDADASDLYPWKRWFMTSDPMGRGGTAEKPVDFFQPNSNAAELLGVYQKFTEMADDISAIPRYMSGDNVGGAGRTASGLAMLMGNASKILQAVAANVDRDILDPLLSSLYDMVMLTDTSGLLTGEESVRVMGVTVAVQRETQRSRQLEFLQVTANPIDVQITGMKGRAAVLRSVAGTIGLDGENIVPTDEELSKQEQQRAQEGQMQQLAAQAQGGQAPKGGAPGSGDMGPRENLQAKQPGVTPRISGGVQ